MTTPRSVLVTGASTGIGEVIARRLDARGWRVFAGVRADADAARLREGATPALTPVTLDVADPGQVAAAAARVREAAGGRLDGLVNNAGIAVGGPLEFVPLDAVRRQFEVNVVGLLAVTQAALPLLREARGRIVNIGSIAGRATAPLVGPYGASKHAVEAFTDALRLELHDAGIEVSVVEPGAVRTPIWRKGLEAHARARETLPPRALALYGERLDLFAKLLAMNDRRGVDPGLVADAVVHALEARRPRTRYLVGTDARIRAAMRWLLPDRWGDAVLRAFLRRAARRLR
jgi:NAD(P)-dependent dehydrogenase (short-subunit alcohol dehydrogenase family)